MLGVWDDRSGNQEGNLSDARIYRKLHLDAGVYTMQAEYQTSYSMSPDAYMFASTKLLPRMTFPSSRWQGLPLIRRAWMMGNGILFPFLSKSLRMFM